MAPELNRWNEAIKLKVLSLLLTGKDRKAYHRLSNEAKQYYMHLTGVLQNTLVPGTDPDWVCAAFFNCKKTSGQSVQVWHDLKMITLKAFPQVTPAKLQLERSHSLDDAIKLATEMEVVKMLAALDPRHQGMPGRRSLQHTPQPQSCQL